MSDGTFHARTFSARTLNTRILSGLFAALLWLAGSGAALAQANSIDAFNVTQQGGKVTVRIQTKEPLRSLPPNFTVASPASRVG